MLVSFDTTMSKRTPTQKSCLWIATRLLQLDIPFHLGDSPCSAFRKPPTLSSCTHSSTPLAPLRMEHDTCLLMYGQLRLCSRSQLCLVRGKGQESESRMQHTSCTCWSICSCSCKAAIWSCTSLSLQFSSRLVHSLAAPTWASR